ncbi:MAG TPA: bile acid:sodium symporter family protein [Candidatus Thermoplasmatota archaeon]|nr:bile acid:sodium symporter family protein [Candidatus Thermoplasmatota archaeon]
MSSHGGLETSLVTDVVLPVALAVIMLGMGLSLTREDFRRVARQPRAVAVGLVAQVVALPLLAMGVAVAFHHLLGLPSILVMGLLLLACCPGGATSNLVTYLARADAALSVSLTAVNSLAAAVTTPLVFWATTTLVFGSPTAVQVSFVEMAGLVALMLVLPIGVGMAVRETRPAWAARAERPFKVASAAFLVLVVAGVVAQNRAEFWTLAAQSVPASVALNVLVLGAGLLLGRLAGLHRRQARAVAIEGAFQNGTLGIALAVGQLGSAQAAIVPGFYSLVMFLTGGALAYVWARDERRRAREAPVDDEAPAPA